MLTCADVCCRMQEREVARMLASQLVEHRALLKRAHAALAGPGTPASAAMSIMYLLCYIIYVHIVYIYIQLFIFC